MALDVIPEEIGKVAQLANVYRDVTFQFTKIQPMTIEEVVEAIAFTCGYAIGNRWADDQKRLDTKRLRLMAVDRLDKGIDQAKADNGKVSIIMPVANKNKISLVKP